METKANHVLIGAFTLAVSAGLLLFALWAAKYASESSWAEYDVVFREAVTGLSVGGIVQYNGITVGSVRHLSLAPDDPGRVIARIRVGADTPVLRDTTARLALTGLTGVAFIQLSGGSPGSPRLLAREDEPVPVIVAEESALQKLFASSEDIAIAASEVLVRLRNILSDENAARIATTLSNIDAVTTTIAAEREDIGALIRSAREASERLEGSLRRFDRLATALDENLTDELPQLLGNLRRTMTQVDSLTRRADVILAENHESLASFGSQGLAQVGPALAELRELLRELTRISARLEDNPAAFLLGRDQPKEFSPR
ncbi:MlaD family protein [Rehaibacterium terrae]|uniref:Phospholipid/cholesterol/gamma-HCH transport system substrate-binding protein n=1 Tax=Rehaibacterium terrae TaxID=1341696 RepID=A0A7W7V8C1_9GAMM|nr:MlaD family protein [Rehaibacterium terrae]MBB5014475.1 phospholipid/cholesterol/gamma-HCH transport system substrate-binding protein [Rehaibacterium terrae]